VRRFIGLQPLAGLAVLREELLARRRRLDSVLEVLLERLEHEQRRVRRHDAVLAGELEDARRLTVEHGERLRLLARPGPRDEPTRSEEHTSELQSLAYLV